MQKPNVVSLIIRKFKNILVEPGSRPTKIKLGLAKGVVMEIDPAHHTQDIYGLYEQEIAKTVRKYALEAKTIIDVGANNGYYTVTASVLNPQANIIACEPDLELKQKCLKNLNLNLLDFSDKIQWIPKYVGLSSNDNSTTLDQLLITAKEPIFIKMDIDGGELEALQSCTKILSSKTCLLVIETHSKELEKKCISHLSNLGYKCKIIPNAWWRIFLPELRPIEHNRWFSAEK
ncbi:MAG: FkbM family methyltransferase [Coleofasciculaceae cyanobacterium]|jgi:predicted RNA methylase